MIRMVSNKVCVGRVQLLILLAYLQLFNNFTIDV